MNQQAYDNYLKNEIEGASQGKLIVMLYDAALKFMKRAITAIDEKNIQDAHNNIIRSENIFYELISTLNTDDGGEIAHTLLHLYDFIIWELVEANKSKDKAKLEGVIKLVEPVRGAWKEIVAKESAAAKAETDGTPPVEHKPINFSG
jgi:flagellar protein FliS